MKKKLTIALYLLGLLVIVYSCNKYYESQLIIDDIQTDVTIGSLIDDHNNLHYESTELELPISLLDINSNPSTKILNASISFIGFEVGNVIHSIGYNNAYWKVLEGVGRYGCYRN